MAEESDVLGSGISIDDDPVSEVMTDEEYEAAGRTEEGKIAQAREDLGIDESLDPLEALLRADDKGEIRDTYLIKRLGVNFVIRPIDDDRIYDKMVERCTIWRKRRGGGRSRELDVRRLARLVVAGFTVRPAFSPEIDQMSYQALVNKYKTEEPEFLVAAALLPGEIDALSDFILEVSGFTDEVGDAAGN